MNSITVSTTEELKKAEKQGIEEIVVIGDLAEKLRKAKKIAKLSKASLITLGAVIGVAGVTAPITGGASVGLTTAGLTAAAASSGAAATGVGATTIIAASAIGIVLVLSVFKNYEEIECKGPAGSLTLKKKQK